MTIAKRVICLAHTTGLCACCFAGIELFGDRRLVQFFPANPRREKRISLEKWRYEDGNHPSCLDIMDVPFVETGRAVYNNEAWLLDPDQYWRKVARAPWSDLARHAGPDAPLWLNGDSTYHGCNDRMSVAQVKGVKPTLRLIRVGELKLSVFNPTAKFGHGDGRVYCRFIHDRTDYNLCVTDSCYMREYLNKGDGCYELGEAYLTVAISPPYSSMCFKRVAAIMERARS